MDQEKYERKIALANEASAENSKKQADEAENERKIALADEASAENSKKRAEDAENERKKFRKIALANKASTENSKKRAEVAENKPVGAVITKPIDLGSEELTPPVHHPPVLYLTDAQVVETKKPLKKTFAGLQGKKLRIAVFVFCLLVAIVLGTVLGSGLLSDVSIVQLFPPPKKAYSHPCNFFFPRTMALSC